MRNEREGDLNAQWQRRCGYTVRFLRERIRSIQRDFPLMVEVLASEKLTELHQMLCDKPLPDANYKELAAKLDACLRLSVLLGVAFFEKNHADIVSILFDFELKLRSVFEKNCKVKNTLVRKTFDPFIERVKEAMDDFNESGVCCFGFFKFDRHKKDRQCVSRLEKVLKKEDLSDRDKMGKIKQIIAKFKEELDSKKTSFSAILMEKGLLEKPVKAAERELLHLPLLEVEL